MVTKPPLLLLMPELEIAVRDAREVIENAGYAIGQNKCAPRLVMSDGKTIQFMDAVLSIQHHFPQSLIKPGQNLDSLYTDPANLRFETLLNNIHEDSVRLSSLKACYMSSWNTAITNIDNLLASCGAKENEAFTKLKERYGSEATYKTYEKVFLKNYNKEYAQHFADLEALFQKRMVMANDKNNTYDKTAIVRLDSAMLAVRAQFIEEFETEIKKVLASIKDSQERIKLQEECFRLIEEAVDSNVMQPF